MPARGLDACPLEPPAPGDGHEGQGDAEIAALRLFWLAAAGGMRYKMVIQRESASTKGFQGMFLTSCARDVPSLRTYGSAWIERLSGERPYNGWMPSESGDVEGHGAPRTIRVT